MKTIGVIGGMSWESTMTYYRILNETVKERLGGLHSAKILLHSVEFAEIEQYQRSGDWARCGEILGAAAAGLERAGADMILIATNTMHKVADAVCAATSLPLLHIAEVTAAALTEQGINRVALLGTSYTMEQDFYKSVLERSGLDVLIPEKEDRDFINKVIFDELCRGEVRDESRKQFVEIIDRLAAQGAQGVILGCTEIGMLVRQSDTAVPLFDTTVIHARRAALEALKA